jgi:NAD-dependent SIR2 family protein deacetylase
MGHTVEYICSKKCGWANATHYEDEQQENEQAPEKCPKCKAPVKHLGARPDADRNNLIRKDAK